MNLELRYLGGKDGLPPWIGFCSWMSIQWLLHIQLHLIPEDTEVETSWEGCALVCLSEGRTAVETIFRQQVSMLSRSIPENTQAERVWILECIWRARTAHMKHGSLRGPCQVKSEEVSSIDNLMFSLTVWLAFPSQVLLETATTRNKEEQNPLPELIPGETVDCHVGKVSPENWCRYHLDYRHGTYSKPHKDGLKQVANSLLVDSNRQVEVNTFFGIKFAFHLFIVMLQDSFLQVSQLFLCSVLQ